MNLGGDHLLGQHLQGCDVVHDPKAPAIRCHHEIVEAVLDRQIMDGSRGQVVPKAGPVLAIIQRHVEGVLGAEIEEARPYRVLTDDVRVAEDAAWDGLAQRRP